MRGMSRVLTYLPLFGSQCLPIILLFPIVDGDELLAQSSYGSAILRYLLIAVSGVFLTARLQLLQSLDFLLCLLDN
jgi:hypothetical protein